MPKRPKTPDSGPEHVKILAIHYPYPAQANLEHVNEQADFVSWMVGCLGNDVYLEAIAWKPKTYNTVLAYVSKHLDNWRCILGEHTWSEAFRPGTYNADAANRTSKVFYSKYGTHREVEKAGWKVKYISSDFVREKVVDICVKPYPATRWCPTPAPDVTNDKWFRDLPLDEFPDKPQPPPRPVVGSSAWVAANGGAGGGNGVKPGAAPNKNVRGAPAVRGAWTRPLANKPAASAPRPPAAITTTYTASEGGITAVKGPANAWRIAPQRANSASSATGSATAQGSENGSSYGNTTAVVDGYQPTMFDDDEDDESQLSSVIDSFATATLFSSSQQTNSMQTVPTTAAQQPTATDSGQQNLWDSVEKEQEEDIKERAKCPVHQRLCNPSMCSEITDHCKRLGIDVRSLKLGGPSNVYTLDQERKRYEEDRPARGRGRGRGDRGRRPNPASARW